MYATATDTMDCDVETELAAILEYEGGVTAEISSGFSTTVPNWSIAPETDATDATRTMRIIDAIYESTREKRPVVL